MTQPFLGQIQAFGFNFAPKNWALCNGQLLAISQNTALFSLLGTNYGGNGTSTFALPNLQSRILIHQAQGFALAQTGGVETVRLSQVQLPAHTHVVQTTTGAATGQPLPTGNYLADDTFGSPPSPQPFTYAPFVNDANQRTLAASSIGSAGGSQPHDNMVPFLVVNFIISLFGIFPSQT